MMNQTQISIRSARLEDAPSIANVHINSWREAYHNLLPSDYLDNLPLSFNSRLNMWSKLIQDGQTIFVAEHEKFGIVGFINSGKNRDARFDEYGEVYAIYLFKKIHGLGVGYQLLLEAFKDFNRRGISKAYLWVLENNPSCKFYERTGATKLDFILEDKIGNQDVKEFCYAWDQLKI